ncbi:MAG: hypothetical protein HKN25_18630 [Pyrinomonadaceae bacterium]|nr:hypothetical protein [Pyrinomonadaceae bacterium]
MGLQRIAFGLFVGFLTFVLGFAASNLWKFAAGSNQSAFQPPVAETIAETAPAPVPTPMPPPAAADDTGGKPNMDPDYNNSAEEKNLSKLYVEGYYVLEGDFPKGFADFQSMEIWHERYDEKASNFVSVVPFGQYQTEKDVYKFNKLFFGNGILKFSTAGVRGMHFEFEGKFKEKPSDPANDRGYQVFILEGSLTKFRNGKKSAKADVQFRLYEGC